MLSIIIPAFNSSSTLTGLLDSIGRSDFKDYEIIVVNDCSTDNTASIIKHRSIKNISLMTNSGPAVARNKGTEAAFGDILLFLDSDTQVESNTLGKIAKKFTENPEIKVLVGTYSDNPLNKGFFPKFKALWFKSLFNENSGETDSLEGFCVAIDARVFKEAGGFNPACRFHFSGTEDYELGCRLRKQYKLYFDSSIEVRHHFPGFFKNASKFFKRSFEFTPLYLSQNAQERGKTLNRDGLASIFALFSFLSICLTPVCGFYFLAAFVVFFGFFLFFSRKLIILANRKEGFWFSLAAITTHFINGIIVSVGIILGVAAYFLRIK